jgi:hypothetical protein
LHEGLPIYSGFLLVSALVWSARGTGAKRAWKQLLGLLLGAGLVAGALSRTSQMTEALDSISQGRPFEYAASYRVHGELAGGRTNYGVLLDSSSPIRFAATVPLVFAEYMFSPLPWQVANGLDAYALAEAVLRFALLLLALLAWWRARGERRSQYSFLLWCYFSLELLWSLGTLNWGTAIRHHLPGYGLLVAVGGPSLIELLPRPRLSAAAARR